MDIIRPRLTDYHGIHKNQADLDFAIQFFDEDISIQDIFLNIDKHIFEYILK